MIQLIDPVSGEPLEERFDQLAGSNGKVYPKIAGAFRLVNSGNYSDSFGLQWNRFQRTQIDRLEQGLDQSRDRLFIETGWKPDELKNVNVLEIGSGAGRFTSVLLEHTGANVFSVDYSSAVEANFRNNREFGNRLKLFQASIYELPFLEGQFEKVICLGVLQHTPDFKKSVESLVKMVCPNGELVIDFYPVRGWWTKIHSKYLLRPITRRMSPSKLMALIENNIDWLIAAYKFIVKIKLGVLTRFLPVCDIYGTFSQRLTSSEIREWAILDTFDMFSPQYDDPQKIETVERWIKQTGLKVSFAGMIDLNPGRAAVIRAIKDPKIS